MPALKLLLAGLLTLSGPSAERWADESEVLAVLNDARADPPAYASGLRAFSALFEGQYFYDRDQTEHATREGAPAVREAARALDMLDPRTPIAAGRILRSAAHDYVGAQGPIGTIGHVGADGSSPGIRVKRRGGDVYVAEVISYGMHNAEDVVRQLIVDDGVPGRGHRKLLMAREYHYAGAWCGPHAVYGSMCVIDLAATADGSPSLPGKNN